jgi:ABC-2 type transport system permease protein
MSPQLIGFYSVLRRETYRFLSIPKQTIAGPLLETYLYIAVFGAALGSRIQTIEGSEYIHFIIPGLLLMTLSMNAFSNNASSLIQQKTLKAIEDQLSSPVANILLLLGYTLGGFLRGFLIAAITLLTAIIMTHIPIAHPLILLASLTFSGLFFASIGVLIGIRAQSFDQISFYQVFVIQPLIFLGGIFYSAELLSEPFKTITHFNPIFYMINTVRYGMLGHSDVNPYVSLFAIICAAVGVICLNIYLFNKGYKIRG